jgi:hypothetical protein
VTLAIGQSRQSAGISSFFFADSRATLRVVVDTTNKVGTLNWSKEED